MSRYIDIDDVANAIYHHFPSIRTMADARGVIEEAPTIDIEPKRGEWKSVYKYKLHARPTCTVCGYDGEDEKYGRISNRIVERFNFCPNCGADMRGKDDD